MIEVRWHGRGGQGAVTAAQLLAKAAHLEGKYCQAFPFFGAERRGAPVTSYTRISDSPIRLRSQIYTPDYVVVLDSTLLETVNVTAGLKKEGMLIINSDKMPKLKWCGKVVHFDVTSIALKWLGAPITNTAILGVLAKATKLVTLDSVMEAIRSHFVGKEQLIQKNLQAVREAYERS